MWHPIRTFGFVYYEVYLSAKTHEAIAWISRKDTAEPYIAFYCDGAHIAEASRGSRNNARAFVALQVARYQK